MCCPFALTPSTLFTYISAHFPPLVCLLNFLLCANGITPSPQSSKLELLMSSSPFLLTSVSHQDWWDSTISRSVLVCFLPSIIFVFFGLGTSVHVTLFHNNALTTAVGFPDSLWYPALKPHSQIYLPNTWLHSYLFSSSPII